MNKLKNANLKPFFCGMFKMAGKLKITQLRSTIGHVKKQRGVIRALGIKRLYQSVEQKDTPQIRGMIDKVKHLVKVEVENPVLPPLGFTQSSEPAEPQAQGGDSLTSLPVPVFDPEAQTRREQDRSERNQTTEGGEV